MLEAKIKVKELEGNVLTLKSEDRTAMRGLAIVCKENDLECVVEVEAKPRVVKFKGVD